MWVWEAKGDMLRDNLMCVHSINAEIIVLNWKLKALFLM